jgi:hypothetical protein
MLECQVRLRQDRYSSYPESLRMCGTAAAPGRTFFVGKRFVVRADEKLTAFLELESAIRAGKAIATRHSVLN